mgnify:CR=1 FL=1
MVSVLVMMRVNVVQKVFVWTLYREYGVEVKIIRIFNTYGPRMACDDGRVVSNFILQALRGKDLTVYGNGMQTRSFQYIDDLIRGIESMMSSRNTFTGPVNIGNPEEYTVLGLARLIIELTGSRSVIRFSDIPSDDPRRRNPDITLARQALHWQPRVSLYEGLQKTIAYYRRLLSVSYEPVVCQ